MRRRLTPLVALVLLVGPSLKAEVSADSAGLPVFPAAHSEHKVRGELVAADFIHRTGQYKDSQTGQLVNFSLFPFAVVFHLNVEADLRDIPLGTELEFFFCPDAERQYSHVAEIRDGYTIMGGEGLTYRIDEVPANANEQGVWQYKVSRVKPGSREPDAERETLKVDGTTRLWKADQRVGKNDLAVGDLVMANGRGNGICADLWIGSDTQKMAADQQRKKHTAFLKQRGLPAWIDRVEGKNLVVTFFGDPAGLRQLFVDEQIDPQKWAAEHRRVTTAVANEELRTYNPPVDQQGSNVLENRSVATDCYGCSGVQWTIETNLLLEGFRRGRIVRIFANPAWPVEDMPFGETLYTERPDARAEEEPINQYSYRTDFGNENLPWYRLQPGKFPPYQSQHLMTGELLKIDPAARTGQFRVDQTGEVVDFQMPPFASARCMNAEADPSDLQLGTRYHFYMYQDEQGKFTQAVFLIDDYSALAMDRATFHLEATGPAEDELVLARQLDILKDDKDHDVRPPDLAHEVFKIDGSTRIWKGGSRAERKDLVAGDEYLVNLTGSTGTLLSRCTDIWIGADSRKIATEAQRTKFAARSRQLGLPAWIDSIDGKTLTLTFFSGDRKEFPKILDADPWGKPVFTQRVDRQLRPMNGTTERWGMKDHLPEGMTAGTLGCSGVRWVLDADHIPDGYEPGQLIRVFKEGWSDRAAAK